MSTTAKRELAPLGPCVLLYVEDDDLIADIFEFAVGQASIRADLFRVADGDAAMAFLSRTGGYTAAPRPDLVLLDLYLPGRSGFEVLNFIRCDPNLNDLKVVVFSSSTDPLDRTKALDLGADGYLIKGTDFHDFVKAAEAACATTPIAPLLKSTWICAGANQTDSSR